MKLTPTAVANLTGAVKNLSIAIVIVAVAVPMAVFWLVLRELPPALAAAKDLGGPGWSVKVEARSGESAPKTFIRPREEEVSPLGQRRATAGHPAGKYGDVYEISQRPS